MVFELIAANGQGFLLCWNFITSSPVLKPNKITDDEVKNKGSIELRLTEPLLIVNKKMRIYSSAKRTTKTHEGAWVSVGD